MEHTVALQDLRCRTVVDIGANRGQFSLLARELFPCAHIFGFEPLAGPARVYERVFAGDSLVKLHLGDIGSKAEERTMHVSARDDSSSLLPIGDEQARVFPGTHEVKTLAVQVVPLGSVLGETAMERPALLKLDVQGFELEALRGCERLLARFDHIYCECSFMEMHKGQSLADEVIAWLHERGFRLAGAYNMAYDAGGKSVQADFLFQRDGSDSAAR
ncbi:MAG: FkbM family methyltransferase [Bryobacteraceae bacterium]